MLADNPPLNYRPESMSVFLLVKIEMIMFLQVHSVFIVYHPATLN